LKEHPIKIRAGRGKMRGRRYKVKKGPLIVVSHVCPLLKTAANIPGVDIVEVNNVNAHVLAPGADIGRLTLFTEAAVERLAKEGLFMNNYKGPKIEKKKIAAAEKKEEKKPAKKTVQEKATPSAKKAGEKTKR